MKSARVATCANCGKVIERKPSLLRSEHPLCSKACYHDYRRKRFDRRIANPETLALPQDYDEFLSKDQLPCLVEGCGWVGQCLAAHMNHTHGIPRREFKKMAGFTLKRGVCTQAISEACSKNSTENHLGDRLGENFSTRPAPKGTRGPMSLQGKEARLKSYILNSELPPEGEVAAICIGCGEEFTYPKPRHSAPVRRYCTPACQSMHQAEITKALQAANPLAATCAGCGRSFNVTTNRARLRVSRGLSVCCSHKCSGVCAARACAQKPPKEAQAAVQVECCRCKSVFMKVPTGYPSTCPACVRKAQTEYMRARRRAKLDRLTHDNANSPEAII